MGSSTINILFSIILLIIISCSQPSNQLIGKWELDIIEKQDSVGNWVEAEWMKDGKGRLQYYDNDTVSLHFSPENYGDEGAEAYWYIANYKIYSDSGFVKHTRVKHSNPDEIGKTVKRYFEIKNDTLTMFAKEFGFRLTWIKQN